MSRPTFDTRAACRGADTELFFPPSDLSKAPEAKAYCNGTPDRPACPVRRECLRWALETGEQHGVLGGMTASERRRHRQATGRKAESSGTGQWRDCDNPECDIEFRSRQPAARFCTAACRHRAEYLTLRNREQVAA
jgi:WhiB family redox-sensing transcriptional regulator